MHFHAEHGLFFETRRPLWTVVLSLASVATVLGLNVFLGSVAFSLVAGAAGILLLLFAFTRGHSEGRASRLSGLLPSLRVAIGSAALKLDPDAFMSTSARITCGTIWILWLGTQVDWASLRKIFLIARIPECNVFGPCSHARCVYAVRMDSTTRYCTVASGRSGAIFECLGKSRRRGALHGTFRLEAVEEERALLRSESLVGELVRGNTRLGGFRARWDVRLDESSIGD